jgi:hypothetical protein
VHYLGLVGCGAINGQLQVFLNEYSHEDEVTAILKKPLRELAHSLSGSYYYLHLANQVIITNPFKSLIQIQIRPGFVM